MYLPGTLFLIIIILIIIILITRIIIDLNLMVTPHYILII